eukprot:1159749-Pelagomonas_calceolata.AAC.7
MKGYSAYLRDRTPASSDLLHDACSVDRPVSLQVPPCPSHNESPNEQKYRVCSRTISHIT